MSLRQVLKRSFIHPGTNIINRSSEATPPTLWAFFQITFGLRKTAQFIAFLAFDVEALARIEES